VELAKAGLIFIEKDGRKQDAVALGRFRAAMAANPSLPLTRTESDNYGELLLNAKDFATAQQVYQKLLEGSPKDPYAEADAYYGLGAADLAQGNVAEARGYFEKMKQLPGGAAWNPHILDADYGIALAAEQAGQPADLAAAKQGYAALMQSQAPPDLQARAMLGYGRVLAAEGATTAPKAGSADMAVYYFKQVDTIFGPAVPELSAEGLYNAAQLYAKAGNVANAQALYQQLVKNYATSAPDWAAKAQAAQ
jgi:tetratricopeptide (TPR) repeat protein